ncbi:MAG: hypothetical protein LAO30_18850 [Acidobacteriia bacterium]|nr:hypothetical protein [Terriglobia bacterium]
MNSEHKFRWGQLLIDCMKQLREEGLPFIDQEVVPNFKGDSNGLAAWFICEHYSAKERFDLEASTEALKKKMRDAGFPHHAVETLWTGVTSRTEIQAGGGRFHFFR